jgi:molybdate-binding protein
MIFCLIADVQTPGWDYYLLVKKEHLEQKNIGDLIDVLKSTTFGSLVSSIPGYDATGAGAVKTIGEAV